MSSSSPPKPQKIKPKSRRANPAAAADKGPTKAAATAGPIGGDDPLDDTDLDDTLLNIRVKERDPDSEPGGRMGRSTNKRLGQLFRDPSPAGIKETIKRPLSGLFRRPGSRSGSRSKAPKGGAAVAGGGDEHSGTDAVAAAAGVDTLPIASGNGHVHVDEMDVDADEHAPPKEARAKKRLSIQQKLGNLMGGHGGGDESASPQKLSSRDEPPEMAANGNANAADGTLPMQQQQQHSRRQSANQRAGSATTETRLQVIDNRAPSPDIPQLQDEAGTNEFGDQVAKAPNVAVNRVSTYRELDSALMKHAAFSSLEDIDLSLLTRFLCPEPEVNDEDVPWSWDYLYTSICTELREDWLIDEQEAEMEERPAETRRPFDEL